MAMAEVVAKKDWDTAITSLKEKVALRATKSVAPSFHCCRRFDCCLGCFEHFVPLQQPRQSIVRRFFGRPQLRFDATDYCLLLLRLERRQLRLINLVLVSAAARIAMTFVAEMKKSKINLEPLRK